MGQWCCVMQLGNLVKPKKIGRDRLGRDYFVVKAGEGDSNAAFAWRLSAHCKGCAGVPLERAEAAKPAR